MPVQRIAFTAFSLKHPAVQQYSLIIIGGEHVLASGNPSGCSVESYFHGVNIFMG
jgi:hypothetical protein